MAKVKSQKPFAVKGIRVTSPRGQALWCKVKDADYAYNPKGTLSTSLVCDPDEPTVKNFVTKLEELRDTALMEARETLGAVKAKGLKAKDVFVDELDSDGEPTGNIIFKFALKDIDDREPPKNKINVVDAKTKPITKLPLVGNGSIIKCSAFANPYHMANTKEIGISLIWEGMQIINLEEYSGGSSAFDEEDGYSYVDNSATDFDKEDDGDDIADDDSDASDY